MNHKDYEWMEHYNLAIQYCKENNCNHVPTDYCMNNFNIGRWYIKQVSLYHKNQLSSDRIELLNKAGFSMVRKKVINDTNWWNNYNLLSEYYQTVSEKTLNVNVIYKNIKLGIWAREQRRKYRQGLLTQEQIDALNDIDFPFTETILDTNWMNYFNAVKKFFEETKGNYVPMNTIVDGLDIWQWCTSQRLLYRTDKLPDDRYDLLKSIDFSFSQPINKGSSMEESILFYYLKKVFPDAKQRDTSHGFELDIYISYNNVKLAYEYDGSYFHENKFDKDLEKVKKCEKEKIILFEIRFKNCGSLQKDTEFYHEYLLDKECRSFYKTNLYKNTIEKIIRDTSKILGIEINPDISIKRDMQEIIKLHAYSYNRIWLDRYYSLKEFLFQNKVMVTPGNSDKSLYSWTRNQIVAYKENRLTDQQIKLLEELIPYGFIWGDPNSWKNKYEAYVEYINTYGAIRKFPPHFKYKGLNMQTWEHKNRTDYASGKLPAEKIKLLQKVDFIFTEPDIWEENYSYLLDYYNTYHHVNIEFYEIYKDFKLGEWLSAQKCRYRKGKLTQNHIDKLEKLGVVFELPEEISWENNYRLLIEYKKEFHHVNPVNSETYHGINIGNWVFYQRQAYRKGTLSQKRIDKLQMIGFDFEKKVRSWEENYNLLIEYKKEYHHANPGRNEIYKNITLGQWTYTQSLYYRKGTLSPDRIEKLEAIGFLWESPNKRKKGAI